MDIGQFFFFFLHFYGTSKFKFKEVKKIKDAIREVKTMQKLSHANVISVLGADHLNDAQGLQMSILTEYCAGGNLNDGV